MRLNQPIVGMSRHADGNGYWLVASDGGIFAFHAPFYGSTGAIHLNQPITGMAAAPTGSGYTMVAADGGLFRFGANSPFYGSAVNACPGAPAVAVAMSPGARGYWIAFADARTYAFSPSSAAPKCNPIDVDQDRRRWRPTSSPASTTNAPPRHLAPLDVGPEPGELRGSLERQHGRAAASATALSAACSARTTSSGENIAAGSAGTLEGSLHDAWMHSDGHRAEHPRPRLHSRVGVGVFCSPDGSIWLTEDFGHPSNAGPPQTSSTTPPVNPIARPDSGTLHC